MEQERKFQDRLTELEALAREQGLDFFPVNFETIPHDIMAEIAAYGLPTRARHWSYGKVYNSQRLYGEMGLSRIYEIVLNSDPGLAFLLDTNPDIANLLVVAHVFGHVDFFKNNVMFLDSNRRMVNDAVQHAIRIDQYIERYGLDAVEHLMDIGFALDRHIDPHKGVHRDLYPERRIVEKERKTLPYEDIMGNADLSVTYEVEGEKIPPHPENDLLWFLINYGKMEAWQKDVLGIIREESYYFYPQFLTKILNEGWASYWHAELFYQWNPDEKKDRYGVTPDEMIEFARLHGGVVNAGARFQINPYFLGYRILVDIEKRWDEKRKDWLDKQAKGEETEGSLPPTGREKIFEVRRCEDDISLLRNYLTTELVQDLQLFSFGRPCTHPPGQKCAQCESIVLTSRERDAVIAALIQPRENYGVPRIAIRDVVKNNLYLEHLDRDTTFLDRQFATQTLAYIAELWKNSVTITTSDERGQDIAITGLPA